MKWDIWQLKKEINEYRKTRAGQQKVSMFWFYLRNKYKLSDEQELTIARLKDIPDNKKISIG